MFLNSRLAKIGIIHTDLCTFCQVSSETVEHFFFQCTFSAEFWTKFENYWLAVTKEQRKLEYKQIILGILDEKSDLLNYFIILGKLYLWSCRRNNCLPLFSLFEAILKNKYDTEKLIASQNKLVYKKIQAKWKPFLFNKR